MPSAGQATSSAYGTADPAARAPQRVSRACDYCRKKRLKCTANQRPCLNCQLYMVKCTSIRDDVRRKRRANHHAQPPGHGRRSAGGDEGGAACGGSGAADGGGGTGPSPPPQAAALALAVGERGAPPSTAMLDWSFLSQSLGAVHSPPSFAAAPCAAGASGSPWPAGAAAAGDGGGAALDGKVSSVESLADEAPPGAGVTIPPGLFVRKNAVDSNYIGFNSVGATLALCFRDALEGSQAADRAPPNPLRFLIKAGAHVETTDGAAPSSLMALDLPPQTAAERAIDGIPDPLRAMLAAPHEADPPALAGNAAAYFANYNRFQPIVDEDEFRARTGLFHDAPSTRAQLRGPDYALFFLIVAIGLLSERQPPGNAHAEHDGLAGRVYQQAWSLLNDSISCPSESSVQILLLHVSYHYYTVKCGLAWILCGLAVRVAQALGFHRQSPRDMDLSPARIQRQSRLWWIAYSFEAGLALSQGRPPAIAENSTDQTTLAPPEGVEMNHSADRHSSSGSSSSAGGDGQPSMAQVYCWRCRLAQLQMGFCSIMHRADTAGARLQALAQVDAQLLHWRDDIPREFRPDEAIFASPDRYHYVLLLHLGNFSLMRAIHWAAMSLAPRTGDCGAGVELASPRMRASESICLDMARSFFMALNRIQPLDYIAACATLYRSLCRNPDRMCSRVDLEHLRAGMIHLQREIHDNHAGSRCARLFESMVSSAEDLVWKHVETSTR
ncbi:hypothetical protein SLS56_002299 [Neofusicoccum ribis]|uniref:Zn(2)-C6 fungal-type domain-containing protein n=1 Tax=Neofusicoccum ribis TaxID=45134 RepID=A0ABR3T4Z9_9PEZI